MANQIEESEVAFQEEDHPKETQIEEQLSTTSDENQTLIIGVFNFRVFGVSKADNSEVMAVLTDIIRTYAVIAIQEIRDKSQIALHELVYLVNSYGSNYEYVVSKRLGRTSSKEQYSYIYNSNSVELTGLPQTYPEPENTDPFHRQPYIASFKSISGNFDAVLMVIHTDPDDAITEINALDDVLEYS